MTVTIYHNPRCSKSRSTLQLLKDNGVEPEIIEYLKTPPNVATLTGILSKLGVLPREFMRKADAKEAGLDDLNLSDSQLIEGMVKHPRTIERPIVVVGDKAAVGRPPESVLALLP